MTRTQEWNPNRTETAIRSLTDADDLPAELAGHHVVVHVGAPANANCQHALFATVNLLARLDTILDRVDIILDREATRQVFHPGVEADTVAESVQTIARRIGSPVQVEVVDESDERYDASVVLGGVEPAPDAFAVRIGSDGWLAYVATADDAQVSFSENSNPVGAYTAGCMAAAEVFKHVLQDGAGAALNVPVEHVDDVVLSTLDYSVNSNHPPNPELPDAVDVDGLHVFGVGAGGGALIHVLGAVDTVEGAAQLVDSDEVSRSNLNRYI